MGKCPALSHGLAVIVANSWLKLAKEEASHDTDLL